MDTTEATEPAGFPREEPPGIGAGIAFMLGLFGYLVAVVAFGYLGLFAGGQDAGDQLATGLATAYLVALVATVAVLVTVRRSRRHHPKMAMGLLSGMGVGILLVLLLSARTFGVMNEVASTCPCEPIIDQVRFARD
ncbi:hypothetical protein ACIBXA_31925 [Micromonospora echinaurantiaca]|uniref:hypothetical protein n=1 Tax=Micromonospora echinaurantiaca TaxID=47857 RepID=UPI003790DE71